MDERAPRPLPCQGPVQRQLIEIQRHWQLPLALELILKYWSWTLIGSRYSSAPWITFG